MPRDAVALKRCNVNLSPFYMLLAILEWVKSKTSNERKGDNEHKLIQNYFHIIPSKPKGEVAHTN